MTITLSPNSLPERDRHRADAAGAAVDQHGLALGREAALEQVGPDGEQRFRQRRRLGQVEPVRDRQAGARGRDAIFGIAAAGDQRADRFANELLGALACFDDLAGDFEAEDVRRARRRRVEAAALEDVGPVDAGRRTLISTSPGPALGTGRSTTASSSAPSGWGATMARIVEGTGLTRAAY